MNDNQMSTIERRATLGLGSVFSLRMLGMFMVLPVLATYGMRLPGANETLIGIAIGVYGLAQAIFQIPFGLLSDRLGRKPMIVSGLLLFVAGSLVAAMSHSIWGIIIGRALQGSGAIAAAVMALLSDLTREQNRTKAMACIGISFGITFAIAMVAGPIVTHYLGLNGLFYGIAILAGCGIFLTLVIVPNASSHHLNRESGMVRGSFKKVLRNPRLLKLNFGILCLHTLLMSCFLALPLMLEKVNLPPVHHWIVYLSTMLIAFVAVIPAIIYAEKQRQMKRVFIAAVAVLLLAELMFWQVNQSLWQLVVGLQLFFLAFNLMEAILPSLISKESPAGYRGTAMGVYSTSQFIGVALGGSLGGWLYSLGGAGVMFSGCVGLAFLWLLISFTMQEPPYVSSIRLTLSEMAAKDLMLSQNLLEQPGVREVVVVTEELSAYLKVDMRLSKRSDLEQFIVSYG